MKTSLGQISNKFQKYLLNTSWLMFEKVLGMGVTFIVLIILARHLGPEQFGILAYVTSLVALFAIAGHAGLSGLVIRDLVKYPDSSEEIMGTSFTIKALGYLAGLLLILMYTLLMEDSQTPEFWMLIILATMLLFQPFDVIDFWFQSHLEAKFPSIARIIAIILSATVKLILIFISANLILFAVTNVLQAFATALLLIFFYKKKSNLNIKSWKVSKVRAKEMLSQGWMVFLGSIFAVIYLKIDQIMLKWLVGREEVGVYAVAASLSEAWYFVPAAIVASFFPKLIQLRKDNLNQFNRRLQQLYDLLFTIALCVAIFITVTAEELITLLFGEVYSGAAQILVIHIWAAIFIFMRAAFSKWILIENVLMFSLISQGLGALTNVALNFWLIPQFGGVGAAYATLFSYAVASYIGLLFYAKTSPTFWMMTLSIIIPIRIVLKSFKKF